MRIGIVGHVGGNKNFVDGQTVKVKSLLYAMTKHAPMIKLDIVDTYYLRKNPIRFFQTLLGCLVRCKKSFSFLHMYLTLA